MLDKLKDEFNTTETLNGDKAYKTTKSALLDLFSSAGAMRNSSESEIIKRFEFAFLEDSEIALKILFYIRDIRGGQGERRLFRTILRHLKNNHKERLVPLLPIIAEYGRYDDLMVVSDLPETITLIKEQLVKDVQSETPSLLAKWLPSENTSSKQTRAAAEALRKNLAFSSKEYRKILSSLRKKIKLVEQKMSSNKWTEIEYDKIPSKAGMKYRKAFGKHDADRYSNYLSSVKKGEKKINTSTLYPYELYDICKNSNDNTIDVMWNNLPNYVNNDENALVMADVSGSMQGRPMSVSVSLAIYFAERNKGKFANHYLTFSGSPELIEIRGSNLYEKINFVENTNVGYDTNIEAAFQKVLDTAIKYKVPQSELPKRIYVISDMQFNDNSIAGTSSFERINTKYKLADYVLPELVFWNVNDYANHPVTMNEQGVQLVSGFSPVLFKQIVSGMSAYDMMLSIVNSERYAKVK